MTEKRTVEDAVYLEGESMIYTISALSEQETNTTQAVYVTYEAPSDARLMPAVDVFNGQYVLHSEESDVLTSIFCGDAELGHREISITNASSLLEESLGSVQTCCAFDEGNVNKKQLTVSSSGTPSITSGAAPANDCYLTSREKADGGSISGSVDLMSSSSSNDKAGTCSKGKSLIFSAIQATLSPDFLEAADDSLREMLQKTTSEFGLEMVHSPETNLYYVLGWKLEDFVQLEKVVACFLDLAEAVSAEFISKSTNTDDVQRPETRDKEISCCLLQPQFSRSGREIRCKDFHLYEDIFDVGKLRSVPVSKSMTAKENVDIKGKKKRGRPPKALQKIDVSPVLSDNAMSTGNVSSHIEKEADALENNLATITETSFIHKTVLIGSEAGEQRERSPELSVTQIAEDATVTKQENVAEEETGASDKDALVTKLDEGDYDSEVKTDRLKQSSVPSKDYESRAPFKHCPLCSFHTKRESHLQKHIQLHDRNIPLLHCAQCTFSTTRQNHLTRHEMQHKSTVYHCDHAGCKYRTDNRRLLKRHATLRHCLTNRVAERQSAVRPALECPMLNCTYKTHRAHLIRRHLARHTAVDGEGVLVEQYSCNACPYETKKREHYLRHINVVHSDVRPYLCDNCGRSFKRKDSLVQHGIVHLEKSSRVYQFECQTCHTKFRSQGHLQDHQAKHTSDRSYLCEICGSSFKTKAVQRKHVLSIHSNPRSFTCTVCLKGFNTRYALKRHASSHSTKAGTTADTETTTMVPQETIALANASHALQVAVITGLQSIDPLQGRLLSIQPQVVSVDQNTGQVQTQVVFRAPQKFALNPKNDQVSQSQFLQQTF